MVLHVAAVYGAVNSPDRRRCAQRHEKQAGQKNEVLVRGTGRRDPGEDARADDANAQADPEAEADRRRAQFRRPLVRAAWERTVQRSPLAATLRKAVDLRIKLSIV